MEKEALIPPAAPKHAEAWLTPSRRLLMLLINYFPLFHVLLAVLVLVVPWHALSWRLLASFAFFFLSPPLAVRLIRTFSPIREGRIKVGTREFFSWWTLCNLQMVFNRLPIIEEVMRLVPGLYSLWLRLWGARIGRLTYWAAGLQVMDRSFLRIGNDVHFGAAVRMIPHLFLRNKDGEQELVLASIVIGDRALIGGYSLLGPGTEVAADECTRAVLVSPPFSKWKDGVRISKTDPGQ